MTKRPYRIHPLAPPLRVVLDDRLPLEPELERDIARRRVLSRAVWFLAGLSACGTLWALAQAFVWIVGRK